MAVKKIYDQTDRQITLPDEPQRIISLVPSQTELLFDLGLEDRIAGVTKFCVHPFDKCRAKIHVGGTKKLHISKIAELQPDLIIANKEENTKEDIETLSEQFPVWISDIKSMDDAFDMIKSVGGMTGTLSGSEQIIHEIRDAFDQMIKLPPLKVIYLIWKKPLMAAGTDTFIDALIKATGLFNVIQTPRYPVVEELSSIDVDVILLSTEPYPFKEEHKDIFRKESPNTPVMLVDGEMFSWYGSRLKYFPDYLSSISRELRSSQK